MKTKTRPQQLAEAYYKLAKSNHHMIGIVIDHTEEEKEKAKKILINQQNVYPHSGYKWKVLNLAIDLMEFDLTKSWRMVKS